MCHILVRRLLAAVYRGKTHVSTMKNEIITRITAPKVSQILEAVERRFFERNPAVDPTTENAQMVLGVKTIMASMSIHPRWNEEAEMLRTKAELNSMLTRLTGGEPKKVMLNHEESSSVAYATTNASNVVDLPPARLYSYIAYVTGTLNHHN